MNKSTAYLGVSYRYIGPRGGKGKPIVYYKQQKTMPYARQGQMEAVWRCKEKNPKAIVWEWES